MSSLAIVGTGIAGLGCAHFLRGTFDVTVFEQDTRLGGHTHTVDVPEGNRSVAFDTGFMVFNQVTYPHLTRLFTEFQVPIKPTSMSFSVRHADSGLEYCGTVAQPPVRPAPQSAAAAFLADAGRHQPLQCGGGRGARPTRRRATRPLGDYVQAPRLRRRLLRPLPRANELGAVWSTPPELMLKFPATTLLRFFHNHGFLGLHTQHPWWTVDGGARTYVDKLTAGWRDRIKLNCPVTAVTRTARGVSLTTPEGVQEFDQVILACHADQSLRSANRSHLGGNPPAPRVPLSGQRRDRPHRRVA
jgi:predicted NAD/FAD-binding protein